MSIVRARALRLTLGVLALAMILFTAVAVAAIVAGYRPVVLQTGSMGDYAPAGSLVIAQPRQAADVAVGDVVVMRRPGLANVTHRVIEIEQQGENRFAITKGDANEAIDPTPYPLQGEQLVARWALAGWGSRLQGIFQPTIVLFVVALAVVAVALSWLRRIWAPPPDRGGTGSVPPEPDRPRPSRRRRRAVALAVPLLALTSGGIAWALFSNNELVASNDFSTVDCFDPQLSSVQNGETIHAIDGPVSVAIAPVDPTRAFVMTSVRSTGNEPPDATVMARLAGGGTTLELQRSTDAAVPPLVVVGWSVIEYGCGISVQRGTVSGGGTDQVDLTIPAVDVGASFVLVTSAPEPTAVDFGGDDLYLAELTSPTNLRIRSAATTALSPQRTFAWQVVSFDDPADVAVQTAGTTLAAGVTTGTIVLPTSADPDSTFLLTGATSTSTGTDIGERAVRTSLSSPTTVEVSRLVGGDPIDVQVQAVTLRDGSTVRHGTVDFAPGQPTRTITVDAVDPSRSTAISTVALPGPSAGGSTDMTADDVIGEASATFGLADAVTVVADRAATSSNASFGWQVVEWAGPQWWDPGYVFRQRIDVTTATEAAPDEYSVPLVFDHAALVTSGLARADGADIRVARWDGLAWTELDRILDDTSAWNQTTTTVWFRTLDPIAAASTQSYWLYFGNPTPPPPAEDPENVYALVEGFESGTLGDFEDRTAGTGWYDALPWSRRIPLTVPAAQVPTTLSDYPLLVSLTDADLIINAQADGSDVRFTAVDGSTPLPHEIERFDAVTGTLVAWVLVPTLPSGADTTVYLYYGATDAPSQQDHRASWPSPVEAGWHLARDPAGAAPQLDDSSARNHDGVGVGAMTSGDLVSGLIGDAVDLDGSDDAFDVDPFDLAGTSELTLSGWVHLDALTSDAAVVAKQDSAAAPIFDLRVTATAAVQATLELDGSPATVTSAGGAVGLGAWHHLAATWDGTTVRLYVDAIEVASGAAAGQLGTDPAGSVTVGNVAGGTAPLDGRLDEVRVERAARPVGWLSALDTNHRTPATFVVPGPVETGTWFDQGPWLNRKPLAIPGSQVSGPLADQPVLVQLVDADLQAKALASGDDIVFTASDGVTRLDHYVESYDGATGALSAWVAVPSLDPTAVTELFVYYGNAAATDQQDPAAVFGPDADLIVSFG